MLPIDADGDGDDAAGVSLGAAAPPPFPLWALPKRLRWRACWRR
jgi:hypothetical protein